MSKQFKRHRDYGFFDQDIRLSRLTQLGDPLERLAHGVDFEMFGQLLEVSLSKPAQGPGGRRPYDYVLMFKILILQRYYNLSDDQTEFQINDRMSFMRFLGLTIADDIPDSKTIWNFREQITQAKLVEQLFALFSRELERLGLVAAEGKIIDASFVEVPRQRNTEAQNEQIKAGERPEAFDANEHVGRQKDTDARWTQKGGQHYFGYKNHIKVDSSSKLITAYEISAANEHDSQAGQQLAGAAPHHDGPQEPFYGDSAYVGPAMTVAVAKAGFTNEVCQKGYRNRPLNQEQKQTNRSKSSVRCRVEHIFGFMEMSMQGMYLHAVGSLRISGLVGLMNLTYNMFRKVQLSRL